MVKNRHIEKAIKKLGGPVAAAEKLGAKNYQTVQQWKLTGSVPAEYCKQIEMLTGISVKLLHPNKWQRIWPELVDKAA